MKQWILAWLVVMMGVLAGCGGAATVSPAGEAPTGAEPLQVVATTSIVGDVVRQVAGDTVALIVLMPPGTDVHGYEGTPQDAAVLTNADLVFVNGFALEEGLMPMIENNAVNAVIVEVSDGIAVIESAQDHAHEGEDHADEGEDHAHEGEDHVHEGADPHTWWDVANVMVWVENIRDALNAADPANAVTYTANAAAYMAELQELDAWVTAEVAKVPEGRRLLVTDHMAMGYFAERHGFTMVGAVVPSVSSLAQPSAQELAELEDAIRAIGAPAIFIGETVNESLAARVAEDTGTKLVQIFVGSLTPEDGPANSYVAFIRHNVTAIVTALQ